METLTLVLSSFVGCAAGCYFAEWWYDRRYRKLNEDLMVQVLNRITDIEFEIIGRKMK